MKISAKTNKSENPFYGLAGMLALYQLGSSKHVDSVSKPQLFAALNAAWTEAKDEKMFRELFFIIVFSFGDITNRKHNALRKIKNLDGGGKAWRQGFIWVLEWMRHYTQKQYYIFLFKDVIRQFVGLLSILITRVKTLRNKPTIVEVVNTLAEHDLDKLAKYMSKLINKSNPAEKNLIAKALPRVRLSKRQKLNREGEKVGGRNLLPETTKNMLKREQFYMLLSDEMSWGYTQHKHNVSFEGMNAWKKKWNGKLESVLFSSGRIIEFDHDEFFKWLSELPAGARYRVRRRLLNKDNALVGKWKSKLGNHDLGEWFLEWEKYKETKQEEERVLVEKERTGDITEDEIVKLEKVKKEAKVNIGAMDFKEELEKWLGGEIGTKESDLVMHSIMSKMKLEVPALIVVDTSGSMGFNRGIFRSKHGNFMPYEAARMIATMMMLKNPSPSLDNFLITFGSRAEFITDGSKGIDKQNKFMQGTVTTVPQLIDREKSFSWNYNNLSKFINSDGGGTNIDAIYAKLKEWYDNGDTEPEKAMRKETIQGYPVFIGISDGDLNNQSNAKASFMRFKQNMLQTFGWNGVFVLIDIKETSGETISRFKDIENFFHLTEWNASTVNTLFTNLHDLEIMDVYTILNSIYKSNRWELIKKYTE